MTSATGVVYDPFDPALMRDPWSTYAWLREQSPVHFVRYRDVLDRGAPRASGPDAGFYVLSRFADVFAAARDTTTFSSAHGLSLDGGDLKTLGLAPTIVMMDPPDHTSYRRLVSRGFTPRRVDEHEAAVRAFVVERIEALRARLGVDDTADFVAEVARPVPCFVVAQYLGVPAADRGRFDAWTEAIVAGNAAGDVLQAAREAIGELYGYFTELVERRRREPGDDMVSTLVQASLGGDPVPLEAVLGYAFVMIAGGNDTATGLLGGMAELLTAHPDQRRRLRDDPSLIPTAVDESLRLTSPVQGLSAAARLQGRVVLDELLRRLPDLQVDSAAGRYAPGAFVRRFTSLPCHVA
jgi:cytochrome P450 family 130